MDAIDRIERTLGTRPTSIASLSGGCVGEVYRAHLPDGTRLAAKIDSGQRPKLDVEAMMLGMLSERTSLPLPAVIASSPDVLVLEYVEHGGGASMEGEQELAEMLAEAHAVPAPGFGFEQDTLIGPIVQPNSAEGGTGESWPAFFAERRLLHFGRLAEHGGGLPAGCMGRLEALAGRLEQELDHAPEASLIHGDLWAGNVLWRDGRVAALIDPAIYHADPEVELAFIALMGGMGRAFWTRSDRIRPKASGDWARRRKIYQLYPLLVHATLFGRSYGASVDAMLRELAS